MKKTATQLKLVLVALFAVLSITESWSQVTIDAQIRPRAEFRNGFKTLSGEEIDPAFAISQRTRLTVGYTTDKIIMKIAMQDVRVWGDRAQASMNDGASTMVNEAWAQILFNQNFSLKLGRQALSYDDERILGGLDWAQQGRWHDAMVFMYNKNDFTIHVGGAFNQQKEVLEGTYYDPAFNNYKNMQYTWMSKKIAGVDVSALVMNTGFQYSDDTPLASDTTINYLQTMGINLKKNTADWGIFGSIYHQTGKNKANQNVNAWLASVNAYYKPTNKLKFGVGTDYVTGQDMNAQGDKTVSTFDPLYGTHHKFYGFMDYFYVGSPHQNVGLWDKYISVDYKVNSKWNVALKAHHFNSAADIYARTEGGSFAAEIEDSYLGTELDFTFGYKYNEYISLVGGYSQMFASSSMEVLKGGSSTTGNNWAWLMLNINPRIFTSKK
ncbi:alginate export family protein [Aureibacter tunicatorum]|uniref:Alginate export domain-containing protein n=1 Tax=Aureibacter tunicatorum TaxID=866807 RepID=A0AAE3XMI5_9BACT|nr:alginate export family protein [Aureibacter tunicatorum]MDR6239225.1 hypothetical protein [Aureibacter tunicatorum]BDD04850.1 hypothetical protein AUTU_23330 [Aureibacter tunicatorum]